MRVAFSFTNHRKIPYTKNGARDFCVPTAEMDFTSRQWRDRRRDGGRIEFAAQRYAIPSQAELAPYGLPGAAMIADEKAARQKNHEKRTVFHGFLLFMRQKRVFMKSEVKIIF